MKRPIITGLFSILTVCNLLAQGISIKGIVSDQTTSKTLPYATVIVPGTLQGTVTNAQGVFDLILNERPDSLSVSFVGYADKTISLKNAKEPLQIVLAPYDVQLQEIIVHSKSPLQYIRQAIKNYRENIPDQPFATRAYFGEKSRLRNDSSEAYLLCEAVFKSYFKEYASGKGTTNQLTLYREHEEGTFRSMLNDNKKLQKKLDDEEEVDMDVRDLTGEGPGEMLKATQEILSLPFFDKENQKKIKWSFGEDSYFQGTPLIAIDFRSKKVEQAFHTGTVYLDYKNLAIVALDYTQKIKIPFLVNTLIKTIAGFKIESVESKSKIRNQVYEDHWYPKELVMDITILFKQKKEIEYIERHQVYNIDKIETLEPNPIPEDKQFDPEKEYAEQVFEEEGFDWKQISIVR